MQEETDWLLATEASQFLPKRHQMKIMDPDNVVRAEESFESRRESAIHRPVLEKIVAFELHQIHAVVQKWPQTLIGETVIEAGQFFIGHINGDNVDSVDIARNGLDICRIGTNVPTPTKPTTAGCRKRLGNSHCQTPGLSIASRIRNPIGNDNETPNASRWLIETSVSLHHVVSILRTNAPILFEPGAFEPIDNCPKFRLASMGHIPPCTALLSTKEDFSKAPIPCIAIGVTR